MLETPFHLRTSALCESHQWRDWSGFMAASLYEPTFEREYFAVRNSAALFDVSPLYKYDIKGPDAEALMNRIMTRDFSKCGVNQVMYSCWCDEEGKLIQDGNAVRLAADHFRISAADPTFRWFDDCAYGYDAQVVDVSFDFAALALQGPRSRAVLEKVFGTSLGKLRYFKATTLELEGVSVLVTRTGFTGDLGYELWTEAGAALLLWDKVIAAGKDHAIQPAGMIALDAARIEAGLVLIEVDFISAPHALLEARKSSPFDAGLGFTVKFSDDRPFVGRAALEAEVAVGPLWDVVGLEVSWDELERVYNPVGLRPQTVGRAPSRVPAPVYESRSNEERVQVGQVTSQTFSPLLRKHIGLATVRRESAVRGAFLEIEMTVEFRRELVKARVVDLPFFDPERKRSYDKAKPGKENPGKGKPAPEKLGS